MGEKASKVKFQQLDVSSADSIKAFVESFKAEEKIDTLVNNAGLNKKNSELTVEGVCLSKNIEFLIFFF